jgi:hypothetical protein
MTSCLSFDAIVMEMCCVMWDCPDGGVEICSDSVT